MAARGSCDKGACDSSYGYRAYPIFPDAGEVEDAIAYLLCYGCGLLRGIESQHILFMLTGKPHHAWSQQSVEEDLWTDSRERQCCKGRTRGPQPLLDRTLVVLWILSCNLRSAITRVWDDYSRTLYESGDSSFARQSWLGCADGARTYAMERSSHCQTAPFLQSSCYLTIPVPHTVRAASLLCLQGIVALTKVEI